MMGFTDLAKAELAKPLDKKNVKPPAPGKYGNYVEGWHVIAEANRIFGFDGWTRETVDMKEVRPPELVRANNGKETWRVGFICKVRVTAGGVVREGTGYGSGAMPDMGEAYESAVKEAETDAMKRALMTFGNPFGLALYDKTQANVSNEAKPQQPARPANFDAADFERRLAVANTVNAVEQLREILKNVDETTLPEPRFSELWGKVDARVAAITVKPKAASAKASLDALDRELGTQQ